MNRIRSVAATAALAGLIAACGREAETPRQAESAQEAATPSVDAAADPNAPPTRQFHSEAEKNRARYYWTEESLAPYGEQPAESRTPRTSER